jgi:RHS repeat-associated protein
MGSFNFSYDVNGNLTQDDLYKYKYDAENRQVEVRLTNDTLVATYAYDGYSLRVIKVVGADRTWYLYAGDQVVSEFEDAASNTYSSGTTPGSAPSDSVAILVYQHSDHLTTRVTTDQQGYLANQQGHYPFGELWYSNGTADPSVLQKFTSYEKDGEVASGQLHYAIHRTHGARIGRFLRPDPVRGRISNPQRLNRYAYVTGNPIRFTDRDGLDLEDLNPDWFGGQWDRMMQSGILIDGSSGGGGGGGGKPPLQLISLANLPDILPSLNIFDAIHIVMDPDDGNGYKQEGGQTVPIDPKEDDALTTYGFLSTNGVVTFQTSPSGGALNPNAAFLQPNQRPTINIGQIRPGLTIAQSPAIWEFFSGKPDPRVPLPFWFWQPPEQPKTTP